MRLFQRLWGHGQTDADDNDHAAASSPSATAHMPFGEAIEQRTQEIGLDLLESARQQERGVVSAAFWRDRVMDWAMRDPAFKTQLFRFVDVYPMLRTPEQVREYLRDYLAQPGVNPPRGMYLGLAAMGHWQSALARTVESQVRGMAQRFIAGRDAASALPTLHERWQQGMAFSIDLLGEACVSEQEAAAYQEHYISVIDWLAKDVHAWPMNDVLQHNHLGEVPRANVSIKITSLHAHIDPADHDRTLDALTKRVMPILQAAADRGVFVNFDMEHEALKDLTIALFQRCCEKVDFAAGLAMQAYLRSGDEDAQRLAAWAARCGASRDGAAG